jgi:mono/diheme cytochrome c family protein
MTAATKTGRRRRSWVKIALIVAGVVVALFVVAQFIPYGKDHTNPPATNAFVWASPEAEKIARESCYDCHSNETKWWWATNIAPASWLVWNDVSGGREHMNFSEWNGSADAERIREAVNGEMPPLQYTLIHPNARLTDQEKQTLVDGFAASVADQTASPTPAPTSTSKSAGGEAVAIINQKCSVCHSADPALQFRATSANEAKALVDSMIQRGALVTPSEEQALIDYFTR